MIRAASLIVIAAAATAHAGPDDLTGLSASQLSGAKPVVIADDATGMISGNPAGLLELADGVQVSLLGSAASRLVHMDARPAGYDVAGSVYGSRPVDEEAALGNLATADLPTRPTGARLPAEAMAVFTDVRSLGRTARMAVMVALPVSSRIEAATFYPDQREAAFSNRVHLSLAEDDRKASVLAFAGAWRAHPRFDLGVAAQLRIGAAPTTRVYLPNALAPAVSDTNTSLGVSPSLRVLAAASGAITHAVRGHVSIELPSAQTVRGQTTIRLWAPTGAPLAESQQDVTYVIDPQPLRVAVGASWAPAWGAVAAEAVLRRGSDYRDLHDGATGFSSTVEIGATGRVDLQLATIRAGARFVPSPVPAQPGVTNHGDADRVVIGLGAERILRPGLRLALGLGGQRWLSRREVKDPTLLVDEFPDATSLGGELLPESLGLQTNNPGFPAYTIGGWLGAAALTLTWER